MMKKSFVCLTFLLLCTGTPLWITPAFCVGRAQIVVSSVYWGDSSAATISARPGDVNIPLSIVLANVGDDVARAVTVRLDLAVPFSFEYYQDGEKRSSGAVSVSAGDIQAGTSQRLRFILSIASNATEGIYRLRLQVSYSGARELQEVIVTQNVDVPIWSGKLHIQRAVTLPEKIYPGSTGVILRVSIVNTGQGAEQDVEARLALDKPFKASSSGSDRIFLGIVPSYQTSLAEFRIDIDESATHGDYSIRLLTVVGKTTQSVIGTISLYLNEKARFETAIVSPEEINPGDTGVTVGLSIKNIGGVTAKSVRVQLRPGNYFSGTLTDFLGTLDSNERKTAFITLDIDGKTPEGEQKVDLRIDWSQDENSLYDTVTVTFKVRKTPFVVQYALQLLLAALAVVVLVYYGRRKRKTQNS
jgi:hypothetical protein